MTIAEWLHSVWHWLRSKEEVLPPHNHDGHGAGGGVDQIEPYEPIILPAYDNAVQNGRYIV